MQKLKTNNFYMKKSIFMAAAAAIFMVSCGGGESAPAESTTAPAQQQEEAKADVPETVELTINSVDDMKFDTKRLEAFEGQKVILTLNHTGEMPIEAMGHNWVLLDKGTDKDEFAAAAISAKDTEYIPAGMKSAVIAYTKTIGGGESVTIEFTAPSRGAYDFICSFPGHYGMMNGKFIVK
jgi:azurin